MAYAISKKVNYSFEEAITKVTEELKKVGFGILTEIDVKETFKKKLDVDFPKYKILGACNPPLAHKALTAEPEIGLLLPCNVVVFENEEHEVTVSAIDAIAMFKIVSRNDVESIAEQVNEKLQQVIDNV
jgi:uncharacterized protein (DUF302 family)